MNASTRQESERLEDAPATRASPAMQRLTPDLTFLRLFMVNVYFVGDEDGWVLVDAGLPSSALRIRRAAEQRFGAGSRPRAIVLTHGHFDHVGALPELAEAWDVPVYLHRLELPYVTGVSSYPPPDPTVGGGLMARLAPLYPRGPIDLGSRARPLPEDGSAPFMPGWQWLHTPGHTPGHVSFFREADGALLAGDAFVTVKQESARAVLSQRQELHGPPTYYTQNWQQARDSVWRLAELQPKLAATGHGTPLGGERLRLELADLAHYFKLLALPKRGRYLRQPAIADERGTVALPSAPLDALPKVLFGLGGAAIIGLGVVLAARRMRGGA